MNLAHALHRGQQAALPREPIEFPKYVTVDGKPELALNAEHEAELLRPERERREEDELQAEIEREAAEADQSKKPSDDKPEVANLLSAPDKREQTTPRIISRSKGA